MAEERWPRNEAGARGEKKVGREGARGTGERRAGARERRAGGEDTGNGIRGAGNTDLRENVSMG